MNKKIYDGELKLMELIWLNEPISAKNVSLIATDKIGWNKNTTYTVLKKLESKGYIKRSDPGFICTSLISKNAICKSETKNLADKLFGGSKKALFSALLEDEDLTKNDIDELRRMIKER